MTIHIMTLLIMTILINFNAGSITLMALLIRVNKKHICKMAFINVIC